MSLLAVLEQIAHMLPFQSETEKTAFHAQIHALENEAVTDVKTLLHGVTTDASADLAVAVAPVAAPAPAPAAPVEEKPADPVVDTTDANADPFAGIDTAALQAELAKREAGGAQA